MPYVVSMSKGATSVLGVVSGNFFGNGDPIIIINKLNTISVFKERASGSHTKPLEHLADFSVFASLKFIEALSFVDSEGCGRDVVFLLSVKQQVSVVAFHQDSSGHIVMVTLFHGDVSTCYHQQRPSEMSLCSSSALRTINGDLLPFVTFSLHHGGVFLFDSAAAVASYVQPTSKRGSITLEALFPREYVQNVLKKSKQRNIFMYGHFDASELDVRSAVLGRSDPDKGCVPLYVLYTDSSSKTHVSEYLIEFVKRDETRKMPKVAVSLPWIPDSNGMLSTEEMFRRKGVLLANVETNSCLLHVTHEGLFVIGPQLINFVPLRGPLLQQSGKCVTTVALPSSGAYAEPVCCVSLPNRELLVTFWDGTCVGVSTKPDLEGHYTNKMSLNCVILASLHTIPDSIACVGNYCVVGSRSTNTLWFQWRTGEQGVLINHSGPVFDVTVAEDGPRMSVIASTGVGINGGLSLVRSSVSVHQDATVSGLPHVKCVSVAGSVLILTFTGYSRVCSYSITKESVLVDEIFEGPFDTSEETLSLAYNEQEDIYFQVTTAGLNVIKSNNEGKYVFKGGRIGHAHAHSGLLAFSSENTVYYLHIDGPLCERTLRFQNEISCITVASNNTFLVGEWNSCSFYLCEIQSEEARVVFKRTCSATPCSICFLSYLEKPRVLAGLLNGNVLDIPLEAISNDLEYQETFLMMQPVDLFNLESCNAVLCLGEVPLVIIVSESGFQLTGFDFNSISACSVIKNASSIPKYIFSSKSEQSLIFGDIVDLQKLNASFLSMKATVTRVTYIQWWNSFALSVRHNEKDHIALVMGHQISNPRVNISDQALVELLENERCVFLEPIILGGSNSEKQVCAPDASGEKARVLLIGTTFAFPDEQIPRTSRFLWCNVEHGRTITGPLHLKQLGHNDIDGALQCCCIVPNYTGRIALGVNGCIILYNWSSVDATFVAEEAIRIGTILIRLVPLTHQDVSFIVAFDARNSCCFFEVDTIQGTLKIAARDSGIRGIMDGTAYLSNGRFDMTFGDDLFNIFSLSRDVPNNQEAVNGTSRRVLTSDEGRKLTTRAQYHLGDAITSLHLGSFAPCSVVNEVVPIPNSLVPGVCGPQIIFGTSHGAFGTITPVAGETYVLLKALEVAMAAAFPPHGGFDHAAYREILCSRQERGLSRTASFETTNPESALVFSQRRKKYLSKCVCSGDLIESYLTLPVGTQEEIVKETDIMVRAWISSAKTTVIEFLDNVDLDSSFPQRRNDTVTSEEPLISEANEIFAMKGLPTLPLTREAVTVLIRNLQRIH